MLCLWSEAWIGRCNKLVPVTLEPVGMCEDHAKLRCCSCNAQATHSCEHTGGFVCGMPLCANCSHGPRAPADKVSLAGMGGGHWPNILVTRMRLEWWPDDGYLKASFPEEYERAMRYRMPTAEEYRLRNSGDVAMGMLMALLLEQNPAAMPLHMLTARQDTPAELEFLI